MMIAWSATNTASTLNQENPNTWTQEHVSQAVDVWESEVGVSA